MNKDKAVELKPCPFCGQSAAYIREGPAAGSVMCSYCDACRGPYPEDIAIDAWNTRAALSSQPDPRDDPAHPLHDAVCGWCGQEHPTSQPDIERLLTKITHENGPVCVDQMGEGLAWRPLDYGTWSALTPTQSEEER